MKRIVIRTLGGKGIGYGHYYRCLSLARAMKLVEADIEIIFIINYDLEILIKNIEFDFIVHHTLREDYDVISKLNIDLFILDSYLADNNYLKRIKEQGKLMLVDDNNDIYDSTIPDIIYNGNIHANDLGYANIDGQLRLLGSKYLVMKEEYWNRKEGADTNKEGILITTGGTDEYGIILGMLQAMSSLDVKTQVILGPGFKKKYIIEIENIKKSSVELIYSPKSLKKYIYSSNIVITAGGSSVYEVLTQSSIPILFSIADNQDLICKKLGGLGIEYLGKYPDIDYTRLVKIIETPEYRKIDFSDQIFKLVNGDGARLVAKTILLEI